MGTLGVTTRSGQKSQQREDPAKSTTKRQTNLTLNLYPHAPSHHARSNDRQEEPIRFQPIASLRDSLSATQLREFTKLIKECLCVFDKTMISLTTATWTQRLETLADGKSDLRAYFLTFFASKAGSKWAVESLRALDAKVRELAIYNQTQVHDAEFPRTLQLGDRQSAFSSQSNRISRAEESERHEWFSGLFNPNTTKLNTEKVIGEALQQVRQLEAPLIDYYNSKISAPGTNPYTVPETCNEARCCVCRRCRGLSCD